MTEVKKAPKKKGAAFTVIGPHDIDGMKPGGTIHIDDPTRAMMLCKGGSIEPVKTSEGEG